MSLSFTLTSGDLKEFGLAKTSLSFSETFAPLNSSNLILGSFGSLDSLKETSNSLDLSTLPIQNQVKTEKTEQSTQPSLLSATISNAIIQPNAQNNARYLEITQYLTLTQKEAAQKLGIPCSTFSKRWREATAKRKWPQKTLLRIDKEIATILQNISKDSNGNHVFTDKAVEDRLGFLLKKRQEEARSVFIRL